MEIEPSGNTNIVRLTTDEAAWLARAAWEFDMGEGFSAGFNYAEFRENAMNLNRRNEASPDEVTAPAVETLLNDDDLALVHAAARNSNRCAHFRLDNDNLFNLFVTRTQIG